MRRFVFGAAFVILSGAGLYFGYRYAYPVYTYRYRLSIEIDTPEGARTGSSVVEVRYELTPNLNGAGHVSRISGEATYVDLGNGKNVIALLAGGQAGENVDYPARIVLSTFGLNGNYPSTPEQLPKLEGKADITAAERLLPTFATMRNLADPKTIRIVPPTLLGEIIGLGIELRRVSIEMTKDPVTRQIQSRLPWLPHPAYLNGSHTCGPSDPMHCLNGSHFMRGY